MVLLSHQARGRARRPFFTAAGIVAALLLSPLGARAQSCYDLRVQRDETQRVIVRISADYPKTHAALAACIAANSDNQPEGEKCIASVFVTACLAMGLSECADMGFRWNSVIQAQARIEQAMDRLGCVR
jgi:hypothetical protein